jgi:anti-sigma B factor antagonist
VSRLAAPFQDLASFRCDVVPERASVRVVPVGELDLATVDELARQVDELLEAGFRKLVLDLSELTFIDSSGLRTILQAREAAERDAADLTVLPGAAAVQRSFELAGLAGVFAA